MNFEGKGRKNVQIGSVSKPIWQSREISEERAFLGTTFRTLDISSPLDFSQGSVAHTYNLSYAGGLTMILLQNKKG